MDWGSIGEHVAASYGSYSTYLQTIVAFLRAIDSSFDYCQLSRF